MSLFSRSAFGTVGVCAALALPHVAAAQGDPAPTTLRLSLSTFGGYDTDVTGTATDADTAPSAPYGGGMVSLNFQKRTDKIAFSTRGSTDYRYYRTDEPVSAVSYSGNSVFAADLTSRLNVSASANAQYSPRFVFSLLPLAGDLPIDTAPPPADYGVSMDSTMSYVVGSTLGFRVSRRSTLNLAVSGGEQKLLEDKIDLRSKSYGGGYSYAVTRYAKLRVGYTQQDSDYPAFGPSIPARRYSHRSYDVGVDYSRPLSVSRRTSISFGSGSSAIDNGLETFYNVTATAALVHQMGRTWEANAAYARGLGVVAGFAQPFFADSVNGTIRGQLSRRLALEVTAGYANGNVGLGSRAEDYVSFQANSRLEWVVQREHVGVYGNYYYYAYEFDSSTPLVASIPRQVDRHGVRAGLIFRFPLLQERTPRVTR